MPDLRRLSLRVSRRALPSWLLLIAIAPLLFVTARAQDPPAIAIRDVTVLPMRPIVGTTGTGTTVSLTIAHATVVITGDRITAIGPAAQVPIPRGARIVEGTGKYLMPGLIDMHSHLSKTRASAMGLFVAQGVTTLRDVGGDHEELLRWRREVKAGTRVGPRMFIAGPYLEAARNVERMRKDPPEERIEPFERTRIPVGTPEDARRIIAELAKKEVDFLKIRTVQDRETYLAIVAAAHAHKLRLIGHVPNLPPEVVLQAGQDDIEHSFTPPIAITSRDERLAIWRQFAARRVVIVPTLVVSHHAILTPIDRLRAMMDETGGTVEPRRKYLSKFLLADWREQLSEASPARAEAWGKIWPDFLRDVREMHEAGMDVLAGSDVAVLNVFPGWSMHDELSLFVSDLKMTPAEALERATRRSAAWLGIGDTTGTVEPGKIADLILLDADPLQDIRNTRRIAAVFLRGAVYDRAGIDTLLAGVLAADDLRVDDWGRKPATASPAASPR